MPKASLSGADVDALLFGTPSQEVTEEEGSNVSGRPWRYPAWPRCARCKFRDGPVTSWFEQGRTKSRRIWLCEWCLREVTREEEVLHA